MCKYIELCSLQTMEYIVLVGNHSNHFLDAGRPLTKVLHGSFLFCLQWKYKKVGQGCGSLAPGQNGQQYGQGSENKLEE